MRAAVALAALLNLAAAESSITASPESRTMATASVTIREEPTSVWWDEDFTETGAAAETTSVVVDEDPTGSFSSAETTTVVVLNEDPTVSFSSAQTSTVIVNEDPTVSFSSAATTSVIVNDDPTVSFSSAETSTVIFNEDPTASSSPGTTTVIVGEDPTVSGPAEPAPETTTAIINDDPTASFPSAETTTVMVIKDPTAPSSPGTTMVIVTKDPTVSGPAPETTTATVNDDPTASSPSRKSTTTIVLNENPPTTPPPSASTITVVLNTEPTPVSTDDEDWTEPGNPSTRRSTTLPVLHPYIHYDFGIGTAWPRGTTKPKCTHWTRVGDTHNRWTQDVYTSTVTTTLLHKCGACAIVWTTPHKGYAWAKVYDSSTADYPFTVTEVACRAPNLNGGGYVLPPHTPTDPWSTKTKTQTYASTIYVTYPDRGPSTITPPGVTSPACTSSTLVYGGGALRANKQLKWKFSTERTVTKDCGTCALAWSTNYFWQNIKGDFYHFYTVTNEAFIATTLECGRAVPTEAHPAGPRTTAATVTLTLTLTLTMTMTPLTAHILTDPDHCSRLRLRLGGRDVPGSWPVGGRTLKLVDHYMYLTFIPYSRGVLAIKK
ncbi:hypothetical protein MGU_06664 [Metarhizium guizhouense ARSEF 977]|uniref:Uncharacterized protein n=1 Tax=Metarhizium guizhouense (strain ARSEF 977) TaxID=1276136 RepID=A0A0B4H8W2_METGA|nr:hypothetical protein MGU_06664 [Metarhizium guizhouense ARSEF 977]